VTASTSSTNRGRLDARAIARKYWVLAALGLLAVLVSVAVHHWIYTAYSWNRDESVYVWQSRALQAGRILPTDGGAPTFFWPWLSGHGPGYFFSQYTLGWPLVLVAANVVLGTAAVAIAFGSLLAVVGTYAFARVVTRDHVLALVAAGVMTLSPIFLVQSGVYLGYLFTLGLGLLFGAALVSGLERGRRGRLVVAGLLLGWILMTRPFDAVVWGAAFAVYLLVVHWREWKRLAVATAWCALGVLPLLVATLWYNHRVTGSFSEFPITAADPLDTFGFGLRRLMPTFGPDDYTVFTAVKSEGKNALAVPWFLFGSYLGLAAAGFGLWIRRRDRGTIALLALGLAFPVGYFAFWGMHVSAATANLGGPIYFIPLYAPLAVLIAAAILAAWARRRALGAGVVVVLVAATLPFAVDRLAVNRDISESQVPWKDSVAGVGDHALVFVEQAGAYLLFLNPYSSNTADLDGPILYANDRGAEDLALIASRPGRTPYLQKTSVPPPKAVPNDSPITPRITVVRMRVLRAGVVVVHVRVTNTGDAKVVVASIDTGGTVHRRTLATDATRGATYETEWTVAAPGAPSAGPGTVPLAAASGSVTVYAGFGPTEAAASRPVLRDRIVYRVVGAHAEMLLPPRPAAAGDVNGKPGWIETVALPGLAVTATARSGAGPG